MPCRSPASCELPGRHSGAPGILSGPSLRLSRFVVEVTACSESRLPAASEREIGNRPDDIDERRSSPPHLASANLRLGPTPKVDQCGDKQDRLDDAIGEYHDLLLAAELVPDGTWYPATRAVRAGRGQPVAPGLFVPAAAALYRRLLDIYPLDARRMTHFPTLL